ncbi:bifunctional DNA-formamidopyrimidine glycosylase/DNA-(apurinic or apyrimidinic site) lyase [Candidatus Palauibacter sp.]|uniref:bifunctional DNA-formamidopyrimidine glycosylase/DNA-(apurinic or apyrimidinic site) lyase n=1 Tax=Candidatus Palauibacter sp. TaxID=3101350 RepID=UPI003CC54C44
MPELPEVETMRRDLAPLLRGRRIARVRVHHDDLILGGMTGPAFRRAVRGRTFGSAGRRAKYLLFPLHAANDLEGPVERVLRVQVRMTGRFALAADRPDGPEFRHPGVDFVLDDDRTLFYDDVRRLGGFDLLTPDAWEARAAALGPEPLGRAFTAAELARILAPLRAPIKNVLLDQRRLAGVGNIYASEALHRARIDPQRAAGSLDMSETRRLQRAVRAVLREALADAGTTFRDYRAVNGLSGSFQTRLRVYQREGSRCPRCSGSIVRIVQAGRSSFFCADCQR